MKSSLVILNAADLPPATQLAASLSDFEILVFDPALVDRVTAARIGPVVPVVWHNPPPSCGWPAEAQRLSRELGQALHGVAEPLWPGLALGSWQHLGLYYLHMSLHWYSQLFAAVASQLHGRRLLIPVCDNPQNFYFPSFVPGLLLLQQAQRSGIEVQAYTYGRNDRDTPHVPQLPGTYLADGRAFVMTHLPTCFYDGAYINEELQAGGKAVVNLRAKMWDVPVQADTTIPTVPVETMLDAIATATLARIDQLVDALRAPLDQHLARWLAPTAFRERQVQQMTAVFRAQLVTLQLLNQHFSTALPDKLLISDHDTNFHGPLCAFARQHQRALVVLPHSKALDDLDFPVHDGVLLHHAVQGETAYDVDGRRPAQFTVGFPQALQFNTALPGPVRNVGLLLNGVSLNGVPGADFGPYYQGIARIVQWAADQGVTLIVRSRPGQTLIGPLVEHGRLSMAQLLDSVQGTMADFAQRCDLCLMYDAATSGALELLQRGIPTLNPVASRFTRHDTASMSADLIPRGDVDSMLDRGAALVNDSLALQRFRMQQFLAFATRCAEGQALRSFL